MAAGELEKLIDRIEKESAPPDSNSLLEVIRQLAKQFGVKEDEVAIMELVASGRTLRFVIPEKLRPVGSIPLSSNTALAARTVRERKPDIVNNFPSARHATVFEGVAVGQRSGESIQKIMSTPILRGKTVVGVAQICRKGASLTDAGPDFTQRDVSELQSLNPVLERLLALCQTAAKTA
jgi:GAF domain